MNSTPCPLTRRGRLQRRAARAETASPFAVVDEHDRLASAMRVELVGPCRSDPTSMKLSTLDPASGVPSAPAEDARMVAMVAARTATT